MATELSGFTVDGVTQRRGGRITLDSVDLTIAASGITALIGRSGAGKSSLLRLLNGLDVPDAGTVRWHGVDLADLDMTEHRRRVAHVAQRAIPFDGTVADNLRVAAPTATDERVGDLLRQVGIAHLVEQDATTLSGGEAQRMCIARALVNEPEVILADEPTSALDPEARDGVESLAADIVGDGVAWVWVSHDAAQTRRLADRVVVMDEGRVLASGTTEQIADHAEPAVRRALED
ncbi:MAG: ATP-binding cassette domain-containing protein [Actinomycetota bacterium]